MKLVPLRYRKQAEVLLQTFNNRGNELTWNSDGVIFIDQTSIPQSDIFKLFPYLFKTKRPKNLEGFDDFVQKLDFMGLTHLIAVKPKKITNLISSPSKNRSQNWWYLD